jgi:hypothetical protein
MTCYGRQHERNCSGPLARRRHWADCRRRWSSRTCGGWEWDRGRKGDADCRNISSISVSDQSGLRYTTFNVGSTEADQFLKSWARPIVKDKDGLCRSPPEWADRLRMGMLQA